MTDFFSNIGGGGAPTANLKAIGDFVHGEVVDFFEKDYVPFGKTDPEKNKDGSNRQQLVVIVQTANRNWAGVSKIPDVDSTDPSKGKKDPSLDDGKRAVYVPERSNIQYAIGRALTAAGAGFEKGGTLGVKIANLEDTGKGNPLKVHEAVYTPPAAGAAFFGSEAPAQTPAPVAQEQAQAPAPAPAAPAPQAAPAPAAQPAVDPWGGSATPATPPPF